MGQPRKIAETGPEYFRDRDARLAAVERALRNKADARTVEILDKYVDRLLASTSGSPTGAVTQFAGSAAPTGWLLCDGTAVSRATYADLFAAIGTTYGAGNGSTTFNLPNLKGRVPVGRDSADTSFDVLGETGGAKTHTLTVTEMPSHTHVQDSHNHTQAAHSHTLTDPGHNHTQNAHTHTQTGHSHTLTDPGHNHTQNSHNHTQNAHSHATTTDTSAKAVSTVTTAATAGYANSGSGYIRNALLSDNVTGSTTAVNNATTATNNASTTGATVDSATAVNQNTTATNNSNTTGITLASATATNNATTATNQNTGGGGAHNNLQPYLVLNYIIKT